uniref:RING-type domain-containing protein n=1 Tax=Aegilops tauschii subsp. strangulata TaxID=200361 RepID=A0A453FQD8_AEGTS
AGIIRKTRTVMECLHRFCRDCIDKSMRLGNNECPACRTHCASRRSLRDDPNYDALIATLYPDIDKYEEEELAFGEEERTRNK